MAEEDLIFGKKRHLFGGIHPSDMIRFEVNDDGEFIRIRAVPPNDTVYNDQKICSLKGVIIRRKETGFPIDEFDGDFVVDINQDIEYIDIDAVPGKTYYYSAFPYSTQDVFNRGKSNRASLNTPSPVKSLSYKYHYTASTGKGRVDLNVKLPSDVAGAVICRSTSAYPESITEGEKILEITKDGIYSNEIENPGRNYMYSVFTYNASNIYYQGNEGRLIVKTKKRDYYFGFDLDLNNPDPSKRVTYPDDVDNFGYTPAVMNYVTGKFDHGDWNFAVGEKFMPKPCLLNSNGRVNTYLNPNDFTKTASGATVSTSTRDSTNAMMEWPKIFTKRWEENGIYKFRCSDVKNGADWDCWCNYNRNDKQIDHFYTAIYSGYLEYSGVYSRNGRKPSGDVKAPNAYDSIKRMGQGYSLEVLADRLLISDLLIMLAKNTNGESVYGKGKSATYEQSWFNNGTLDTKGLFWGSNENNKASVKVFGMENYWGMFRSWFAGLTVSDGYYHVKITEGKHDGSTQIGYNQDGTGYLRINNNLFQGTSSSSTFGFINEMIVTPFGRLPLKTNGSRTTYECDMASINDRYARYSHTIVDSADNRGPFAMSITNDGQPYQPECYGARLSYKPVS